MKSVIFDWDGVLFDSLRAQFNSVNQSCIAKGINFNSALNNFVNLNDFDSVIDAYKVFLSRPFHYSQFYIDLGFDWPVDEELVSRQYSLAMREVTLFPESVDFLNSLKSKGYSLGLVTSAYRDIVLFNLGNFFDYMVCNGEAPGKPRPDGILVCLDKLGVNSRDAVYVGDMITDAMAANSAGVPFIGVSWGYNIPEVLRPCKGVANSFNELETLIN